MGRSKEQQRLYMREYRARKRAAEASTAADESPVTGVGGATGDSGVTRPRRHAKAVGRMLDETGLRDLADEAPLVELLLELADEMDSGAALKVRSQYLAALKDARRVLAAAPGSAGASKAAAEPIAAAEETVPEVSTSDEAVTDFARFKRAKGGAAAG